MYRPSIFYALVAAGVEVSAQNRVSGFYYSFYSCLVITVKILKFRTPQKIAVITLKVEQDDFSLK